MNTYDDSINLGKRGFSRIEVRKEGWTDGEVVTPHGIVSVYAQGDDNNLFHTRIDFAFQGRLYMRNFTGKRYTPRGIVTKANQFVIDILKREES